MDVFRIFVVGDTVLAESVAHMLQVSGGVDAVERFDMLSAAIPLIQFSMPDVLILADIDNALLQSEIPFLPEHLDIPVIRISSENTLMKITITTTMPASMNNLIGAITSVNKSPLMNKQEVTI